jgi:hypothetical protein
MPLQQAQTTPSNDSSLSMNLKPVGLGLSRNPSILSQASHNSDSGTTAKFGTRSGGRDWLGRSRSQPRLPLHPQDSHVSIRSDHSSVEDRVRSPPNSAQKVFRRQLTSLTCSIVAQRHTGVRRRRDRSIPLSTTRVRPSDSQTHYHTPLSVRSIPPPMPTLTKNSKNTLSSYPVRHGQRKVSSRVNAISIQTPKSPRTKAGRKALPSSTRDKCDFFNSILVLSNTRVVLEVEIGSKTQI